MGKGKKIVRKPFTQLFDCESSFKIQEKRDEIENKGIDSSIGLSLIAEALNTTDVIRNEKSNDPDNVIPEKLNWAKEVEDEASSDMEQKQFQESAKSHWNSFA
uniref:Uncharacterized protein n=1 Tax=Cannabis sativa TaxID=3483 RepID=A0A803QNN0_CANSA